MLDRMTVVWTAAILTLTRFGAQASGEGDLLEAMKRLKVPYIAHYHWQGSALPADLQEEYLQDYLQMGFTGIQKEGVDGGRVFRKRGLHGFMWQTYWGHPDLEMFIGPDGNVMQNVDGGGSWLYGNFSSEKNMDAGANAIMQFLKENEDAVFELGGYKIANSWDETGLQACYRHNSCSPHSTSAFRQWLERENKTVTAMNQAWGSSFKSWEEINIPKDNEIFDVNPFLWKAYKDFKGWELPNYFHQIQKRVESKGIPFRYPIFAHAFMTWPNINSWLGLNAYQVAQTSPVLINEHFQPDFPVTSVAFAWTDRLSREYQRPVLDYAWFLTSLHSSPTPRQIERAFGRSLMHTTHGYLMWVYLQTLWRTQPEMRGAVAFWHHFFQDHWGFLKEAEPLRPQIAVLFPGYAGYFYKLWDYPKQDYCWGAQALIEAQYPFTVVQEEEVEKGILNNYKALVVFSAERTSAKVLEEIGTFIDNGGCVFADGDSLARSIDGKPTNFLQRRFGVEVTHKAHAPFMPTYQSKEEQRWAESLSLEKKVPLPASNSLGCALTELPDTGALIDVDASIDTSGRTRTWHDIVTGRATGGKVLATYQGRAVGVETERTVWWGTRPGMDMEATFDRKELQYWGEPVPAHSNSDAGAMGRAAYRSMIAQVAEKAGIARPITVLLADRTIAPFLEVGAKTSPNGREAMVFLINHEPRPFEGQVILSSSTFPKGAGIWNLRTLERIKSPEWGRFVFALEPGELGILYLSSDATQGSKVLRHQRELLRKDLRPKPFTYGPRTIAEPPLPQVVQRCTPTMKKAQGAGAPLVEIALTVINPDPAERADEPVALPVSAVPSLYTLSGVKSVSLADGTPAQWDDLDGSGGFSAGDEIAWQQTLKPGANNVTLLLSSAPIQAGTPPIIARAAENEMTVTEGGKTLFRVRGAGREGGWDLRRGISLRDGRPLEGGSLHGGPIFLRAMQAKAIDVQYKLVCSGPVRSVVEASYGYEESGIAVPEWGYPHKTGDILPVRTVTRYVVYGRMPEKETRLYACIRHTVTDEFRFGAYYPGTLFVGYFLELGGDLRNGAFKDTLGRVCPLGGPDMENNFGGWMFTPQGKAGDAQLTVLARRMSGIVSGPYVTDEHDGIQVHNGALARSSLNGSASSPPDIDDTLIHKDTAYTLDALIRLHPRASPSETDRCRAMYACPPRLYVDAVTVFASP